MKSQYSHFIISDYVNAARHIDMSTYAPAQWKRLLYLGLSFSLCGVIAIVLPNFVTLALNVLLGIIVLSIGVLSAYYALSARPYSDDSWPAVSSVVLIVCGLLLLFNPLIGAVSLTLILAIFFILTGLGKLALAEIIRPYITWNWVLISGLIDIGLSFFILFNLVEVSNNLLGILLGISFLMQGWWNIRLALNLRKLNIPLN